MLVRSIAVALVLASLTGCSKGDGTDRAHGTDTTNGAFAEKRDTRALDSLRESIASYLHTQKADVGVTIYAIEDGDTLSVNGDSYYPLMSVMKFPQAVMLLKHVDDGKLKMSEPIRFDEEDLKVRTASTILKDHPQKSFSLTIPEVLAYSIGQSDNITSDRMFELVGGPGAVGEYIRSIGVDGIRSVGNYRGMDMNDSTTLNHGTPKALALLLKKFYADKILSDSSSELLWRTMVESLPGADRIKGQLPEGTVVAHKTGTGGTNAKGQTVAFNDVGIIQLPNGKHLAIAVLVSKASGSATEHAKIISTVSKMAWDHFAVQ
jgi:beta-lactamase class A